MGGPCERPSEETHPRNLGQGPRLQPRRPGGLRHRLEARATTAAEVIPAFVRDADEVDQLVWNPLAHHNLTTFLKRKMPDPANAKIGVCVKGCDSRTLVALLQEELVDKDRLYVIGVPCDGVISRRRIEKEFADEVVDIAFAARHGDGHHAGRRVEGVRQGRPRLRSVHRAAATPTRATPTTWPATR